MSNTRNDSFFKVPRRNYPTSAGPADLPILYYDTTEVQAYFLCDRGRVEGALGSDHLRPGLTLGNKAVVGLVFFEYRDTSIGPYNEIGLAVPVVDTRQSTAAGSWRDLWRNVDDPGRRLAFHVLHLPVTTEAANAAGRELWGLPKFVTEIPFEFNARRFRGGVLDPDDGSAIVELAGRPGLAMPAPTLDLLLFSNAGGRDLRTTVITRGHTRALLPGSVRLHIGNSSHPMAATLRRLGLQDAKPVVVTLTPDFQSRLNAGIPMLAAPTSAATSTPSRAAS